MTDRLNQITREAHPPKARTAFDEAILAAARDQATLNAQQLKVTQAASSVAQAKAPWWKAWPMWAGSGSFAAVIASVLLVTGHQVETNPSDGVGVAVANAPAPAVSVPAPTPAPLPAVAKVEPAVAAEVSGLTIEPNGDKPSMASAKKREVQADARAPTMEQASGSKPSTPAAASVALSKERNREESAPTVPPAPAPAAARKQAVVIASDERRADSAPSGLIQAPRTIDQCVNDLRTIPVERRVASDLTWMQIGRLCKAAHPAASWPADLGPMSVLNIESTKE